MQSMSETGGTGLGLLPIITVAAANGTAVYLHEESGLQRAMTVHQKALEADEKGRDIGHMHTDKVEDINDPPPKYDA